MLRCTGKLVLSVLLCAGLGLLAMPTFAGTIIKLSLGDDPAADLEYSAAGVLSTIIDSNGASTGEQDTAVEFLDYLSALPNIPSADASFTLDGVTASGPATLLFGGTFLAQPLTGGTFSLYDASNALLLAATLDESVLTGPVGAPATGGVVTTTFGSILPGGLLNSYITDPDSISLAISMTEVNGGAGLGISPLSVVLPFTADATGTIAATGQVPEPATALLVAFASLVVAAAFQRDCRT